MKERNENSDALNLLGETRKELRIKLAKIFNILTMMNDKWFFTEQHLLCIFIRLFHIRNVQATYRYIKNI